MTHTSEIRLNDFVSFENFLFGAGERDWTTFLEEDGYFISPIANPITIAHHQLCHYAYWMTIAENNFTRTKPSIISSVPIVIATMCYACAYADKISPEPNICSSCPLKKNASEHKCGVEYHQWYVSSRKSPNDAPYWAEKIAKMIWKDTACDSISEPPNLA